MTLAKAQAFLVERGFHASKGAWINRLTGDTAFIYYLGNNKYKPEID